MNYQQINTPQPFSLSDLHQQANSPTTTMQQEPQQQQAQPQPSQQSANPKQQQYTCCTCQQSVLFPTTAVKVLGPSQDHSNLPKQLTAVCLTKIPKQEALQEAPHKTYDPQTHTQTQNV